jgi:hypothetical protein
MTWLTVTENLRQILPWICSVCRNHIHSFHHSWLIAGIVARVTPRISPVEQELLTLSEHLSSPRLFVRFVFCVFCVVFWISLFVLWHFFRWSLYLLSFFNLGLLITPLKYSSISHTIYMYCVTVTVPIVYCKNVLGDFIKTLLDSNFIDM